MESAVHHNSSESDTISDATLPPAQAQVIAALAQGRTITDAARDAGIHRTTIHHWFRTEPVFKAAFQEAQREYVDTLHDRLRDLAARAVETLRNLLNDPNTPPAVRLRTALAILQRPKQGWQLSRRTTTQASARGHRLQRPSLAARPAPAAPETTTNDALAASAGKFTPPGRAPGVAA
jgi:AcrR family transcriptional regulator